MKTPIEDKIKKGIKRVLLYGNPDYILIDTKTLEKFKKEKEDFRNLVYNGGKVTYTVEIDVNECPRMSEEWKEHLCKKFHLDLVVTNAIKGLQVIADPGNEFVRLTGKGYKVT